MRCKSSSSYSDCTNRKKPLRLRPTAALNVFQIHLKPAEFSPFLAYLAHVCPHFANRNAAFVHGVRVVSCKSLVNVRRRTTETGPKFATARIMSCPVQIWCTAQPPAGLVQKRKGTVLALPTSRARGRPPPGGSAAPSQSPRQRCLALPFASPLAAPLSLSAVHAFCVNVGILRCVVLCTRGFCSRLKRIVLFLHGCVSGCMCKCAVVCRSDAFLM